MTTLRFVAGTILLLTGMLEPRDMLRRGNFGLTSKARLWRK